MPQEDIDASLSRSERRQLRRLVRAIKQLSKGDTTSLARHIKKEDTRILMAAFENFDAKRVIDEFLRVRSFSRWEISIRRALIAELRSRGVRYEPPLVDDCDPGTWSGGPPMPEEK